MRAFADGALNSKEITHDRTLVGVEAEAERGVLEDFLERLPQGLRYVVEVRHRNWLGSDLPEMLSERGAALTLIDFPGMPTMEGATASFSCIRWLGDRREFPSGHTRLKEERDHDLSWWSDLVGRFLGEGRTVFTHANNLEIRRGEI